MNKDQVKLKLPEHKLRITEAEDPFDDDHSYSACETPMRDDAFKLEDDEKIEIISWHFRQIMNTLGLDLTDDSLKGTPGRVARMYVKEVFRGLNPKNKPVAALFENKFQYEQMLVQKNINIYSYCEHHFVPIIGKAHIAYIPSGKVIGLSKINRIVQYYAKRPQVQERLTIQIANELRYVLSTNDVAVMIEASHLCVSSRGIKDVNSNTITSEYGWVFKEEARKDEFLKYVL